MLSPGDGGSPSEGIGILRSGDAERWAYWILGCTKDDRPVELVGNGVGHGEVELKIPCGA